MRISTAGKSTVGEDFVLRGGLVLLRPFNEADIDARYIGWLNDPDVVRFSNQRFKTHDQASSSRYFASFEGTDNLFISIRDISSDAPLGTMTAYISRHHGTVDVGIMIGEKCVWGSGYGQDAWNTLAKWLFRRGDIRKLTAGTMRNNQGMIKLMERSGMHLEATRRKQELLGTEAVDILYYAKFRGE